MREQSSTSSQGFYANYRAAQPVVKAGKQGRRHAAIVPSNGFVSSMCRNAEKGRPFGHGNCTSLKCECDCHKAAKR